DDQVREYLPARHRTGHLRRLMLALEKTPVGQATNLSNALKRVAQLIRKRGLLVLLSDFLAPVERLEQDLISLTASGHEVLIFQVLDPAELNFTFSHPTMFQDLESGRTLFIEPGAA